MESLAIHQVQASHSCHCFSFICVAGFVWFFPPNSVIVSWFLGGGIWTTYGLINIKIFSRKPELHTPALVWFLSACAADLIITTVLVYTLVSPRAAHSRFQSNSLCSRREKPGLLLQTMSSRELFAVSISAANVGEYPYWFAVTVQTGLITTFFAIGDVLFFMSECIPLF